MTSSTRLKKINIAHIIPTMNYGGVERAIQKSYSELNKIFNYKIITVKAKGPIDLNQDNIFNFIIKIMFKRTSVDVIITSLWWSHLFGFFFKILGYKWYAFYHSSASTHYLNKIITNFSAKNCDICLVDSNETKKFILRKTKKLIYKIPFIFENQKKINMTEDREVDFIFIGRNIKDKRLDILVKFIKKMIQFDPNLNFVFIINGPPSSETKEIESLSYKIYKNLDNKSVLSYLLKSKFYLHFSDREGMSMSTVEAIQCGCIPVIKLSGEIKNYLDSNSAIIMNEGDDLSIEKTVNAITKIYYENNILNNMRSLALEKIDKIEKYITTFKKVILSEKINEN